MSGAGVKRAAVRLRAKLDANGAIYRRLPQPAASRQVHRRLVLKGRKAAAARERKAAVVDRRKKATA